jgi:hypothetical protein
MLCPTGTGPDLGPHVNEICRQTRRRWLWRTFGAVGALACAFSTLAIADDQFVFSDDRFSVRVNVRGMPLGEVLRRLLENTPADIRWGDPALEKQPITGSFNGPIADVVRELLRGTNYIIAHSKSDDAVARVIVLGRSDQTAAFAPGMFLVPTENSPPPPATPPPPQTARPVAPAQVPNPRRRSRDM